MATIQINDLHHVVSEPFNNPQSYLNELTNQELILITGQGLFGDIYNALNDAWTDIKCGIVDALNEN